VEVDLLPGAVLQLPHAGLFSRENGDVAVLVGHLNHPEVRDHSRGFGQCPDVGRRDGVQVRTTEFRRAVREEKLVKRKTLNETSSGFWLKAS